VVHYCIFHYSSKLKKKKKIRNIYIYSLRGVKVHVSDDCNTCFEVLLFLATYRSPKGNSP